MISVQRLGKEVDWRILARCVIVITPLVLAACFSGGDLWLNVAIVTISALIAAERSGLAPLGVAAHGAAIGIGFLALLTASAIPPLFVIGAAALAGGSLLLTVYGAKFRTLGSFTFIPALYLACETAEGAAPGTLMQRGLHFLPFIVLAIIPVLFISTIEHHRAHAAGTSYLGHFRRVLRREDHGEKKHAGTAVLAIMLAVSSAAALTVWLHLPHGQWVIWSAASVITDEAAASRQKLWDRASGALFGVPIGILAGLLLPHTRLTWEAAAIIGLLTIVAVPRYRLAFGTRCACIALAIVAAGQPDAVAAERITNVILGGVVGTFLFTVVDGLTTRSAVRSAKHSQESL